jgi:succinyl-diaminopimelate desuccinylase
MNYTGILSDLVSIDTTVPPGRNYEKALDFLLPLFRDTGCATTKISLPKESCNNQEGRFNLIAHRRQTGKPRLIIYTHVDVVPGEGWDAFQPRIVDGKMYGRGANDDKGNIVAALLALEKVKDKPLKYDLTAIVTVDEEEGHGLQNEIRFLRPYLEPVAGANFLALDCPFGAVNVASQGGLSMEIRVLGKSVHQGRAYLGENAVENAIKLCQPLLKLGEEIPKRQSKIPASPEYGIPFMQGNLSITMMHGGVKVNIVPDECLISIGRRIIPEENKEAVEKEVMDALRSVPGVRWEIKSRRIQQTRPSFNEPITDALALVIKDVTGKTGKYGMMGGLPLEPVTNEWNAVLFGTGLGHVDTNAHGKNEFVYLQDIESLSEILTRFVRE